MAFLRLVRVGWISLKFVRNVWIYDYLYCILIQSTYMNEDVPVVHVRYGIIINSIHDSVCCADINILFETEISRQRKVSKSERNKEKAVQAKDPEKFEIDSKMGGGGGRGRGEDLHT